MSIYRRSSLWPPRSICQYAILLTPSQATDQLHHAGSNELLLAFVRELSIEQHMRCLEMAAKSFGSRRVRAGKDHKKEGILG